MKVPPLKLATDEIDLEEQLHDPEDMVAMSVIENEHALMTELIKKAKGSEKDFYASKQSTL